MRKSTHIALRSALRAAPDGASLQELAKAHGSTAETIRQALQTMPDAYIDRWMQTSLGPPQAVWCVVAVPEHCPKPNRQPRKSRAKAR